ncbi:ABC transporter permease [Larkinella arboricola]
MIQNYFKIAWRSLQRNRLLGFINVAGLSLGMACSLLIGLWVWDEFQVDKGLPDGDRLYLVRLTDGAYTSDILPGPLAEALKKDVPEVDKATKFTVWSNDFLLRSGNRFGKKVGLYASADFFDVFQIPVLQGNPGLAIQSPNAIVITRSVAQAFFGNSKAVGKTIQLNNEKYYRVGAVIENVPKNSSVQFDWIVNFSEAEEGWMKTWNNNAFRTYVKLKNGSTQAGAEARMAGLLPRYQTGATAKPILQRLGDVYLYGEYTNGKPTGGRIDYVRTFSLIALLILLVACVNFMNLATARSSLRAKEVGIRKVVGARRLSLIGQFMCESLLLNVFSAGLAVGLVQLTLPYVNPVVDKQLAIDFTAPLAWGSLLVLIGITSVVAGSYPAFVLSVMQPARVLKGALSSTPTGAGFRKTLVVFQFSLSIFLIVGMLIIGRQMHYIRTKQLGLNRQDLLHVAVEGTLRPRMEAFRQELQRSDAIQAVTTAGELPIRIGSTGSLDWAGKDPKTDASVSTMKVGVDFTKTLGINLLAGRDFTAADTSNYLVNESAVKMMKLENPIGAEVTFQRGKGRIIGVMQDFHLSSFHEPIRPLVLSNYPKWTNYFLIKTQPGKTEEAIRVIEQTARQLNPGYPFDYHFVDEEYEKLYRSETLVNTLINYFGILAIFISCLGLFGLATFTAEQRTKEIGVRKVLGASVGGILVLLSKDFLKLVFVAILLASPVAWWAMHRWLQSFTYRIDIEWWMFALAGLLAVAIALLTVSFQSIRAALMNPVRSLRSE